MVGKYEIKKIGLIFTFLFIALGSSCTNKQTDNKQKTKESVAVKGSSTLGNADIVLRLGDGYFSNYFRMYASAAKEYSHVGLIYKIKDSLYVIHIEASEFTGVGYVKKELLESFLDQSKAHRFYHNNLDEQSKNSIISQALRYYNTKVPFDLDFNSQDDSSLYCSELVAHSINKGLDSIVVPTSLVLGKRKFFGLDDIYKSSIYR